MHLTSHLPGAWLSRASPFFFPFLLFFSLFSWLYLKAYGILVPQTWSIGNESSESYTAGPPGNSLLFTLTTHYGGCRNVFLLFSFLKCFWPHCVAFGRLVPWPGIEPHSLQRKHRVLITGPSCKSPFPFSYLSPLLIVSPPLLPLEAIHPFREDFCRSSVTKTGTMFGVRNAEVILALVKLKWMYSILLFFSFIHVTSIHSVSIVFLHCSASWEPIKKQKQSNPCPHGAYILVDKWKENVNREKWACGKELILKEVGEHWGNI